MLYRPVKIYQALLLVLVIAIMLVVNSCSLLSNVVFGKGGYAHSVRKSLDNVCMLKDTLSGKEVVLVPMVHLGRTQDYERIANYLDTLKGEGYVTFIEGMIPTDAPIDTIHGVPVTILLDTVANQQFAPLDSALMDTLSRKLRRVLGSNLEGLTNYYETNAYKKGKVVQDFGILHLTTDRDLWTDYTVKDFIDVYEKNWQKIYLTDQDYLTDLSEPFNGKFGSISPFRVIRDHHLLRMILDSEYKKIVVVWGAAHTRDMVWMSKKYGYEKVKVKVPKSIKHPGRHGAGGSDARVRQ